MADKYDYSGAAGAGTGADWPNAYTTLTTAFAGMAAGDHAWVADDDAESQASAQTWTSPGTASNPCSVFCARRTGGSTPPVNADLRTTATKTTTGASAIAFNGYSYYYGIAFSSGSSTSNSSITLGATTSAQHGLDFDNCALRLGGTSSASRINIASGAATDASTKIRLRTTNLQFANASQGIALRGGFLEWIGGSITLGTAPTTLFLAADAAASLVHVRDVDLSNLGSNNLTGAFVCPQRIIFERCKLGSNAVVVTPAHPGAIIDLINCDSGSTNYRNERYMQQGTQTTETTVIRTGTVNVDYPSDGTTGFSWKIVTTANINVFQPFESMVLAQDWIDSTGSAVSQTFEFVTDGVTLTDQDAWIEYEYLGTAGTPLGVVGTSFSGFFATGANLTTSTVGWTTTGLASPVKQKITITFTPQKKGIYRSVLKVAKTSTTLYVSPPAAKAA